MCSFRTYRRTFQHKTVQFHCLPQNPIFDKTLNYNLGVFFQTMAKKMKTIHTLPECTSICHIATHHSLFSFPENWLKPRLPRNRSRIIIIYHPMLLYTNEGGYRSNQHTVQWDTSMSIPHLIKWRESPQRE